MFLLTMLLAVPAWAAQVFEGKVVGISDGDTITILTDQKQQIKVRLYGVDCPETKQAYGTRARQFTSDKIFGKRVRVEVADTDHYGRTVGIVTAPGGSVLNSDLLAGGMAWLYTAYCKKPFCRDWKKLEEGARIAHKGLWADTAVPPWEFRKAGRSGGAIGGAYRGRRPHHPARAAMPCRVAAIPATPIPAFFMHRPAAITTASGVRRISQAGRRLFRRAIGRARCAGRRVSK